MRLKQILHHCGNLNRKQQQWKMKKSGCTCSTIPSTTYTNIHAGMSHYFWLCSAPYSCLPLSFSHSKQRTFCFICTLCMKMCLYIASLLWLHLDHVLYILFSLHSTALMHTRWAHSLLCSSCSPPTCPQTRLAHICTLLVHVVSKPNTSVN